MSVSPWAVADPTWVPPRKKLFSYDGAEPEVMSMLHLAGRCRLNR